MIYGHSKYSYYSVSYTHLDVYKRLGLCLVLSIAFSKIKIIEETKPCVVFTESVKVSNTNILVRDIAKIITQNGIPIGAQRLYDWFVEKKYLIRHKPVSYTHLPIKAKRISSINSSLIKNQHEYKRTDKVKGGCR